MKTAGRLMSVFEEEIVISGIKYHVFGNYKTRTVDNSFSHEFGIESSYCDVVDDVDVTEVFVQDEDGDDWQITPMAPLMGEIRNRIALSLV